MADLASKAIERGVETVRARATAIVPNDDVIEIALADGGTLTADRVVLAAGAWSKPLAASLGDPIPLDTERGYNLTLPPGTLGLSRPIAYEGEGFVTTPLDIGDRMAGRSSLAAWTPPRIMRVSMPSSGVSAAISRIFRRHCRMVPAGWGSVHRSRIPCR